MRLRHYFFRGGAVEPRTTRWQRYSTRVIRAGRQDLSVMRLYSRSNALAPISGVWRSTVVREMPGRLETNRLSEDAML